MNRRKQVTLAFGMAAVIAALVLAGPVSAGTTGQGTMTVTPDAVAAGATGVTLHFTFKATTNGASGGGQATVDVPAGWPAPQTAVQGAPGYVSVAPTTCKQASVSAGVGSTIAVAMTCKKNQSFDLTYGPVKAPAVAGNYAFTTSTAGHSGSLQPIATQPSVSVSTATATHFAVSAPTNATTGSSFNFTVTALDQFDNTAVGYNGTVHFKTSDASGILPADTSLNNGTRVFSATFNTVGSQTLTATDTADSSITGTSNAVAVSTPLATHFAVSAPGSTTAGNPFSFTVTALDASNKTVTGYNGTIHFTSSDGQVVLPANSTLSNGTGAFSATLKTAGSQTITATDTADASLNGTSNQVAVSAAAATHFTLTAPASATGAITFSFTVTARDQFDNTAVGYLGTIHFTTSDASALLPADKTLNNGSGVFSAAFDTAGGQALTATDTSNGSITGTSNTVTVSAPVATHFTVSAPASTTAGNAFSFTVTARDALNKTVAGYNGTIHFTSSDGQVVLPANTTLSNGTGVFSATLKTAGNQTITATDTADASLSGTSNQVAVSPAAATHFTVVAPANANAGTAFSFTVTARDQFNNIAVGYTGTVHFTMSAASGILPADQSLTNGSGSFSATFNTAGSQTLTAKDTANNSITGTSNTVTVS